MSANSKHATFSLQNVAKHFYLVGRAISRKKILKRKEKNFVLQYIKIVILFEVLQYIAWPTSLNFILFVAYVDTQNTKLAY